MVRAGASATRFDRVIYAAPAHAAERIELRPPLAELAAIARIEHPPVSVVALGFRAADVTHPLDGFGVLVPEVEGLGILGAIFSSTLFPDRAPEGHVLVTAFVGGTRHPAAAGLPDQALIDRVVADLRRLVGVRGAPVLARVGRWPRAIPQYAVGHQRLVRALDRMEQQLPGFYTAGTYRDGIAVGDALASGQRAAERLLRDLGSAYVCATTTG
jgi:oxygen-dependent protoporphyrinogen oxidase